MSYIKFLGTGGARFVVAKQLRATGGIWFCFENTNLILDPGPGSLVRAISSKPRLDPQTLNGILLSHIHIDHSNDVNVYIEAITDGGTKKRGTLFAPKQALSRDSACVFPYTQKFLEKIEILKEGKAYTVGEIQFTTPKQHIHPVETYGFIFEIQGKRLSFITDTKFFHELSRVYKCDLLVMNILRLKPNEFYKYEVDHLSVEDAKIIIKEIKPKLAVMTHFGMTLIKAKPWEVASQVENETGIKTIAASDGMKIELEEIL